MTTRRTAVRFKLETLIAWALILTGAGWFLVAGFDGGGASAVELLAALAMFVTGTGWLAWIKIRVWWFHA